ncbi:hypothetical protein ACQJBY_068537 [Aegilops geniculata]
MATGRRRTPVAVSALRAVFAGGMVWRPAVPGRASTAGAAPPRCPRRCGRRLNVPAVRVPLLSCGMWSGSPRGTTKARRRRHAPSPSRPYVPQTSAVQICRGRCSDKRFGGKKLIQPWSSPRRRTSSITPAAVQVHARPLCSSCVLVQIQKSTLACIAASPKVQELMYTRIFFVCDI